MVVDGVAKIEQSGVKLNPLLFENAHIGLLLVTQENIKPVWLAATQGPEPVSGGFDANGLKVAQLEDVVATEK